MDGRRPRTLTDLKLAIVDCCALLPLPEILAAIDGCYLRCRLVLRQEGGVFKRMLKGEVAKSIRRPACQGKECQKAQRAESNNLPTAERLSKLGAECVQVADFAACEEGRGGRLRSSG